MDDPIFFLAQATCRGHGQKRSNFALKTTPTTLFEQFGMYLVKYASCFHAVYTLG